MDILRSSNFERLLYYLALETSAGGDRTKAQETLNGWMGEMKKSGRVDLGDDVKQAAAKDFWAERVSDQQVS
jgi:threonine synthase